MKKLVVIGSGVMGRGIAYVSCLGGFNTVLIDVDEKQLHNAEQEINTIFEKGMARGKITADEMESADRKSVV